MTIEQFQGEYRWLSNFWPVRVTLDGYSYPSVEHAYQASKTLDRSERLLISTAPSAGTAKRLGKRLKLRRDWDDVKVDVMYELLCQKFSRTELRRLLLATGDQQIIEGNSWGDTFWGVCRGEGQNHLGKLIMQIRDELRAAELD